MNFLDSIKKEILNKNVKEKHCRIAFLAGLIRGAGSLYEEGDDIGLLIRANDEQTANFIEMSLKSLFDYDVREVSVSEDKLNKKDKFYLSVSGEKAFDILTQLNVLEEDDGELLVNLKFYGEITQKECCLRAFIRGLFVAIGNCTLPNENENSSTGYHLELNFSHYTPALETSEKLAKFNVSTKITRRREDYLLYIKSAEEIKNFLAFLPAPVSVLKLTDLMINRELSNNSNRQKNCDLGNVNKQVEASAKQIDAINKIKNTIGLDALKPDLKETALIREKYPEDTLSELAERLSISKSCLNHRLRKIVLLSSQT
ncbi:MAG: DNA-binding protein WhiA [Clostridiales bacterium]|nr:DNA-binding protein WhiA [Clostridiales bacterium]